MQNPIITHITYMLAGASEEQLRIIYMTISEILKKS